MAQQQILEAFWETRDRGLVVLAESKGAVKPRTEKILSLIHLNSA